MRELDASENDVRERAFANERVIDGSPYALAVEPYAARRVALRVAVYEQSSLFCNSKARGEIDGCGCLPHATFLIGNRDDPSHQSLPSV